MKELLGIGIFCAVVWGLIYGVTLPNGAHYKVDFSEKTGVEFKVHKKGRR